MLLPEEVASFIEAGHGDRLTWRYINTTTDYKGLHGYLVRKAGDVWVCTFFTRYAQCGVHHMKPFEGRMVDHDGYVINREKDLLAKWRTDAAQQIVQDWIDAYE